MVSACLATHFSLAGSRHHLITETVHAEGGKIGLQILHAGRYGYNPLAAAPLQATRAPINYFTPRALSGYSQSYEQILG